MKRTATALFLVLVVAIPVAVSASGELPPPQPDGRVRRHAVTVSNLPDVARTPGWRTLSEFSSDNIRSTGVMTATVSAQFSGGPVDVRVRGLRCGGGAAPRVLAPGRVRFRPPGGHRSTMAFTFMTDTVAPVCRRYDVQWRLASEQRALHETGTMHIIYNPPPV